MKKMDEENDPPPSVQAEECLRYLRQMGAWRDALEARLDGACASPARRARMMKHLDRIETSVMMAMLAHEAAQPGAPRHSLRRLAQMLDGERVGSMTNTLRALILPAALEAGWIDGFSPEAEAGGGAAHQIGVTAKGLAVVRLFFDLLDRGRDS